MTEYFFPPSTDPSIALFLSLRREPVMLGQPLVLECVGGSVRCNTTTPSCTPSFANSIRTVVDFVRNGDSNNSLLTYTYPSDRGFPVVRIPQVTLGEHGNRYNCFYTNIPPLGENYGELIVSVHGRCACVCVCVCVAFVSPSSS